MQVQLHVGVDSGEAVSGRHEPKQRPKGVQLSTRCCAQRLLTTV